MVWGAFGRDYRSPLIICPAKVNAAAYQQIITDSGMVSDLDRKFGRGKHYFMQDGALAHTAQTSVNFLNKQCKVVPGWPPNSPDLNPIEIVWAILKHRLQKKPCNTIKELTTTVLQLWNELTNDTLNRLSDEFPDRLRMALDINGSSISTMISSHKRPQKMADKFPWMKDPTEMEKKDNELMAAYQSLGSHWKAIGRKVDCPPQYAKYRIRFIEQRERNMKFDSDLRDQEQSLSRE